MNVELLKFSKLENSTEGPGAAAGEEAVGGARLPDAAQDGGRQSAPEQEQTCQRGL